jgi:hypothetical protein
MPVKSARAQRIIEIIQRVTDQLDVLTSRGQGAGNLKTIEALNAINAQVRAEFGSQVVQCTICPGNKQSVDFFLKEEGIVIELEYSLRNPYPCLEKDLFKVFLAKEAALGSLICCL